MKNTSFFVITLLLIGVLNSKIHQQYDTIIIGAGIAGIGASMVLSNNSIPHLLIQARNRIGGRITSFNFANTTQELGAAFVQFPKQNNLIHSYVSAFNITKLPVKFSQQTYWYVNQSRCLDKELESTQPVFKTLIEYIYKCANAATTDEPVSNIVEEFWDGKPQLHGFIKDSVTQYLHTIAVDNGAQLNNLSTIQFSGPNPENQFDYSPNNGYSAFLKRLFDTFCDPKLHLSQTVRKIDYSSFSIVVTTNRTSYITNKLIIGVPLGVLKAGQIQFVPPLPSDKAQAIDAIGFGKFQKLFVTFSAPFWPANSSNLQFIGKHKPNRYSQAWVVPPAISQGKHMLIFWISGNLARQLTQWQDEQIKDDLISNLASYISSPLEITDIYLTDWQHDPYTLGSYSFAKVGTKKENFKNMKSILRSFLNRIWFIGEYVDPEQYSFSHGAFKTGVQAAKESLLR